MDNKLYIPWLGIVDSHPASIHLPKIQVQRAAEARGMTLTEMAWRYVRRLTCLTRLDATLDKRFQPDGSCRGIDVIEVNWSTSLREEKMLAEVANAIDAAIPLDCTLIQFEHFTNDTIDTRLAIVRQGQVALDQIYSHSGIMSCLPIFLNPALEKATSISTWHKTLFNLLQTSRERSELARQLQTLRSQMAKEKDFARKTVIRKQLMDTQSKLQELL